MNIKTFIFNPFYENTYVVSDDDKNTIVIDPGCYEEYEKNEISKYIEEESLNVQYVINTHCHIDHVLGNQYIKEKYDVPLWIPEDEKELFESVTNYAPMWGITNYTPAVVDKFMDESELEIGNLKFEVRKAPGHSPGHLVFYSEKEGLAIAGDVLFRESIGRTDLPGGNHETLLSSIRNQLFTLPDETVVYAGHGPETTIGYEKKHNPFLR